MAQRRDSPTPGGSRRPGQRGQTSRGRVAAARSGDTSASLTRSGQRGLPIVEPVASPEELAAAAAARARPAGQRQRSAAPRPGTRPGPRPGSGSGGGAPRRSRFTARAFVLLLVLVALAVSYASSTRAYLDQRDTLRGLKAEIAETEAKIADLEREKRRWEDPSYVRAQARSKLGYLMPGETGYQVLDENGQPLQAAADLHDPDEVGSTQRTPWWEDVWSSVELAGNPPEERAEAPTKIDGVKKNKQQEKQ